MDRMKLWYAFTYIVILYCLNAVLCGKSSLMFFNETENHLSESRNTNNDNRFAFNAKHFLKRDKRYIMWTGGGNAQFSVRLSHPVELRDRANWRMLSSSFRYYFPYVPIPNSTFLWDRFASDLRTQKMLYDEQGDYFRDLTRDLIYGAMELFLDTKGKPGRQCLLKSICDAAEHPIVRGSIFEEIVHLILTPSENEQIDDDYKNARLAGERGTKCETLYDCPHGDGLLDKFSYLA